MRVFLDKLTGAICNVNNPNLFSIYEKSEIFEEVKEAKEPKKTTKSK